MDVARPPQKSAVPNAAPSVPQPAPAVSAPVHPAVPSTSIASPQPAPPAVASAPASVASPVDVPKVTPAFLHAAPEHHTAAPVAVRQAPKDDDIDAPAPALSEQPKPAKYHPKKQPKAPAGPAGAITLTVLVMIALSAVAVMIYLNT